MSASASTRPALLRLIDVVGLLVVLSACGSSARGITHEAAADRPVADTPTGPKPAAAPAPTPASGPRVVLMPPGADPVSVRVELARDAPTRQRGLMYRQHMADDSGMLFLFERPDNLTFWMRNTYIALDMIFIEPTLRVLGVVENAEPMTETSRAVPGHSQYVLEVNAGWSRRNAVTKGTAVRFEGIAGFESETIP